MSFTRPFLLGPVFFRSALQYSGGYHLERAGMPLHDAIWINCENCAIIKYQGADVKYMGLGVFVDDCLCSCVLSDLT